MVDLIPVIHWTIGCGQNAYVTVARHQICAGSQPVVTFSEFHVSQVCRLIIRAIMGWYLELCRDLLIDENLGKRLLGDRVTNALRPVIVSNGITYIQMTSVGSDKSQKFKRRKEGKGMENYDNMTSVWIQLRIVYNASVFYKSFHFLIVNVRNIYHIFSIFEIIYTF